MSMVRNPTTDRIDKMLDKANVQRRIPMNGILVPGGMKVTGARGNSFGRARRSQIDTSMRVKVKAVKTVVRMPIA